MFSRGKIGCRRGHEYNILLYHMLCCAVAGESKSEGCWRRCNHGAEPVVADPVTSSSAGWLARSYLSN